MNKLLECTRGPWAWDQGDIGQDYAQPYCTVYTPDDAETFIADVNNKVGASNAALIAAAFDHALIGWAMVSHTIGIADGHLDEPCSGVEVIFYLEPAQFICRLDPFGFPTLTDDLRARLIAEMEATP